MESHLFYRAVEKVDEDSLRGALACLGLLYISEKLYEGMQRLTKKGLAHEACTRKSAMASTDVRRIHLQTENKTLSFNENYHGNKVSEII